VLDASAVVAFIAGERGAKKVAAAIRSADGIMSAVNLSEALVVMTRHGMPEEMAHRALGRLGLGVRSFGEQDARLAAQLHSKRPGLSFGDRACLALAQNLGLTALTADAAWRSAPEDIRVQLIR
jgi:PIN domain nuclease of toxin-antitoxin system